MNRPGSGHLNGEPLTPGELLVFGGSVEAAGAIAPFRCGMLSVTAEATERAAALLHVKSRPPAEGEFRIAPLVDGARLIRAFAFLSRAVHQESESTLTSRQAGAMEHAFLEVVTRSLASESRRSSRPPSAHLKSAQVARGCEDYARGLRYRNVTLADLCKASDVSERRVRSAFYQCYQMSPTAYLRVSALNAVRRQLLQGSPRRDAVSRAATDWGFWHLSRFAAQYRALFGESPSQTLAHRLDRPHATAS